MGLYRNIAGADRLGLFQLADIVEPVDGLYYGGGGDTVFYDPGTYEAHPLTIDPITLSPVPTNTVTPSQPLPAGETTPVTTIETVTPAAPATTSTDVTATTAPPLPAAPQVDWLPIITIAGLFLTIFKGEQLLKGKEKIVFIGGLGALYFEYARKK